MGDFNGDGRVDVVRIVNHQMSVLLQQETYADRLYTVTDEGTPWSREAIIYSSAWTDHPEKMGDYTCGYPRVCVRRGVVVVRAVASQAHLVDPPELAFAGQSTYYAYEDPVTDPRGRGFLGFGTVRVWDPQRLSETVTTVVPILTQTQVTSKPSTATARVTRYEYTPMFMVQPDEKVYPSQIWSPPTSDQHRPSTWLATHPAYGGTVATMDANGARSI